MLFASVDRSRRVRRWELARLRRYRDALGCVDPSQDHSSTVRTNSPDRIWSAGDIIERRGNLAWQPLVFERQGRGHWPAVRAPSSGAVTPGASRTQSRATWSGSRSSPSAARTTPSTATAARFQIRLDEPCEVVSRRPRSAWVALRYGPVSTPRPSGDNGSNPMPKARTAGSTSTRLGARAGVLDLSTVTAYGPETPVARWRPVRLPAYEVRYSGIAHPAGRDRVIDRIE